MPSESGKQHRAMEAAAHGASALGIPKKVGAEFAAADKGKKKFNEKETRAQIAGLRGKREPPNGEEGNHTDSSGVY